MRDTFVNTLCGQAREDKNIYLLSGDLGFGVLDKFWNEFPGRFINMGICEQNMACVAVGMALEGKNVFIYSIANFSTLRCMEQIRNDIAYHQANVKVIAVGGGFSYGAMGVSHHATEDLAMLRAIPGMTVFSPCDPIEAAIVTKIAANLKTPCYIRLGKGKEKKLHEDKFDFLIGKANQLCQGKDTAILASGPIAAEAVRASEILKEKKIECSVYSFPTIKPIDTALIESVAKNIKVIFTLEEHNIMGGFGSAVSEIIAEINEDVRVVRLGLNDTFSCVVGSQEYLRNIYKIDAAAIADRVLSNLHSW